MIILLAISRLSGVHSLLEAKTVKSAPMDYVSMSKFTMLLIYVYTVTFNSKQAVLFSNCSLVYIEQDQLYSSSFMCNVGLCRDGASQMSHVFTDFLPVGLKAAFDPFSAHIFLALAGIFILQCVLKWHEF